MKHWESRLEQANELRTKHGLRRWTMDEAQQLRPDLYGTPTGVIPSTPTGASQEVRPLTPTTPPSQTDEGRSSFFGLGRFLPDPVENVLQQIGTMGGLIPGGGMGHTLGALQAPFDLAGGAVIDTFNVLKGLPSDTLAAIRGEEITPRPSTDPRDIMLRQQERGWLPRLASELPTGFTGGGVRGATAIGRPLAGPAQRLGRRIIGYGGEEGRQQALRRAGVGRGLPQLTGVPTQLATTPPRITGRGGIQQLFPGQQTTRGPLDPTGDITRQVREVMGGPGVGGPTVPFPGRLSGGVPPVVGRPLPQSVARPEVTLLSRLLGLFGR